MFSWIAVESYVRIYKKKKIVYGEMGNGINGEWKWDIHCIGESCLFEKWIYWRISWELLIPSIFLTLKIFGFGSMMLPGSSRLNQFIYSALVYNLGVRVSSHAVSNQVLAKVWKSWASSKVIVFSWQLLQDKISSPQNLFRRNVTRDLVIRNMVLILYFS
jgi:hypothetical protein